jgi:epoxyqueuosine reductase
VPGVRREQGRLREDLRLSPNLLRGRAAELALQAGFHRAAIVDPRLLLQWASRLQAVRDSRDAMPRSETEWHWITNPSAWSQSSTILVCCLSCLRSEPDDPSGPGEQYALVAPFARANYYRAAIAMLRTVAARLEAESGIPRASIRLFSNSSLPEKPLLAATGIAAYGKNGCMIVPGLGSMFVIAGAVIPVPTEMDGPVPDPIKDPCGSCQRCRLACPVGALERPFIVQRDLCLQGKAGSAEELAPETMQLWGTRLYGCQDCQAACPHNDGLKEEALPAAGEIGPGVPLRVLLAEDAGERKRRFHGTSLGMSWIAGDALLRNALMAAGNCRDTSLRSLVARYVSDGPESVRRAARWALERL